MITNAQERAWWWNYRYPLTMNDRRVGVVPMERVYTAPAVKFNGTGFYSTGG
jgi:predicted nucleic acid-binding Zn ribbon protein